MQDPFKKHLNKLQQELPDLIDDLTTHSRNFFDESWQNKGFTDDTISLWLLVKDKDGNDKERPLVETGALRRSLRTERIGNTGIVFTETPYAKAHNEGYEGQEEVYVSAHTRTRNGKTHDVKSFNRQQKTAIPQRQFMGQSKTLDDQCEEIIKDRMNKIFN